MSVRTAGRLDLDMRRSPSVSKRRKVYSVLHLCQGTGTDLALIIACHSQRIGLVNYRCPDSLEQEVDAAAVKSPA